MQYELSPSPEEDDQALFNGKLEAMRKAAGDAAVVSHNATTCASYGNFTFHVLPPNLFMVCGRGGKHKHNFFIRRGKIVI